MQTLSVVLLLWSNCWRMLGKQNKKKLESAEEDSSNHLSRFALTLQKPEGNISFSPKPKGQSRRTPSRVWICSSILSKGEFFLIGVAPCCFGGFSWFSLDCTKQFELSPLNDLAAYKQRFIDWKTLYRFARWVLWINPSWFPQEQTHNPVRCLLLITLAQHQSELYC